MHIEATFRAGDIMGLKGFPFDSHKMQIVCKLWGSSVRGDVDCGRVLLPLNCVFQNAHDHPEWYCYSATAVSTRPRGQRQGSAGYRAQVEQHLGLAHEVFV